MVQYSHQRWGSRRTENTFLINTDSDFPTDSCRLLSKTLREPFGGDGFQIPVLPKSTIGSL